MNKMIIINDSNWVRLSAAYKKIIAKKYWRFIFDLLSLAENSILWKHARTLLNQLLYGKFWISSNLHVLRPFREVHGRFFFSDGK